MLAICPRGGDWLTLRLVLGEVSAWRAAHTNTSDHQVLSDGFSLLDDAGWYLDLAPDFSQVPSATVIQRSAFFFAAQTVEFEVLPYDYLRA